MIGETILHYKIIEKLGEGGMGIVYLAEDIKLKRKVAIKFLPHHISANEEERQRFLIEAQAAAALNHPNIATIYAIEETDDLKWGKQAFIIMEFIEGKELKEVVDMHSDASLQLEDVINYAIQIAQGLEAAHKKGIIHRDIKSSNIMITSDGKIKIMDFGLAKIRGGSEITKIGSTAGTAAYMSPEQLKGANVDERTDIWSFGIVLYEMITGKLPFSGAYEQATSYSIVNEKQKPVSSFREDIPEKLLLILNKCLSKNADERYNGAEEILNEFNALKINPGSMEATATLSFINADKKKKLFTLMGIIVLLITASLLILYLNSGNKPVNAETELSLKRIAVLPFTNINNNPEVNFLSFALADQIINSLAYIRDLIVRPSSTIRPYQNIVVDLSKVSKKLNVDYILSGSYQKESDEIRLNLELVKVDSDKIVWHDGINVKYENAFKLQDIVSKKVVNGLKVKFSPGEETVTSTDIPNDPIAYEYFLRAVSNPIDNEGNMIAIALLKKSMQIDSNFAPAYTELGYRYHTLATYAPSQRNKLKEAETAYKKALSINNESLSALGDLASIYAETGNDTGAVQLIKEALKINPNNAQTHFGLGYIFRYTGLLNKSAEEMENAIKLDPSNVRFRSIGATYLYQLEYKKALGGLNLDKDSPYSLAFTGQVYLRMKKIDSAKKYFEKAIMTEPEGTLGRWSKVMLDFINGNKDEGLAILKSLETSNTFDAEQFYNYANLYGLYGDKKNCIRLLKRAIDGGFYCYPYILKDSFLDPVRNDKEFQEVLAYAKSRYEKFKKTIGN
jgi:serine/threonine protein kinase/Tfp pilus assembly protein PilF